MTGTENVAAGSVWITLGAAVFALSLAGLGLSLLLGAVCGRATASEDRDDAD